MRPQHIRLFSKSHCPWCHQAIDWLDARHIPYELIDVITDQEGMAEMQRISGQTLAPTIEVDGRVLADFDTAQLAQFWKQFDA
jgi:monothiol glutaredoxin